MTQVTTRRITVSLPEEIAERLTIEALAKRTVDQPSLSRARDEIVTACLRDRFSNALNPVARRTAA